MLEAARRSQFGLTISSEASDASELQTIAGTRHIRKLKHTGIAKL
jgi:hypothetical protein